MSRPAYAMLAADSLDEAIEQFGKIKATGTHMQALNRVYGLLLEAKAKLDAAVTAIA